MEHRSARADRCGGGFYRQLRRRRGGARPLACSARILTPAPRRTWAARATRPVPTCERAVSGVSGRMAGFEHGEETSSIEPYQPAAAAAAAMGITLIVETKTRSGGRLAAQGECECGSAQGAALGRVGGATSSTRSQIATTLVARSASYGRAWSTAAALRRSRCDGAVIHDKAAQERERGEVRSGKTPTCARSLELVTRPGSPDL